MLLGSLLFAWRAEVASTWERGTTARDNLAFYTGARLVRDGQTDRLYDLEAQRALQAALLPPEQRPHPSYFLPFVLPPFVALALAPLSSLSVPAFYTLFGIVQLVLLALLFFLLQRIARQWPESWRLVLLVLTALWLPNGWALFQGQFSILLAVIYVVSYLLLQQHKDKPAGMVLGALWIKPQYAVLVLPYLLLGKRWAAMAAFAATSLLLLLVSWLAMGTQGLTSYAALLKDYAAVHDYYPTLRGLLHVLQLDGGLWLLSSLCIAIVALWQVKRGLSPGNFASLIFASMLASAHSHSYELTVLLGAIAIGWEALKDDERTAGFWAFLWLMVTIGLYGLTLYGWQYRFGPLLMAPAMLVAIALLVVHARRHVHSVALSPANGPVLTELGTGVSHRTEP